MNTLKYITLSVLSVLFLTTSCNLDGESNKPTTAEELKGQWDLISATRNEEKTSSLEGTYMNFSEGKMACNFTGEEVNTAYSIENNELTHGEQKYKIEAISASELVVSTKLSIYDFKLTFAKTEH